MAWHVAVAVDAQANGALAEWARTAGGDAVAEVVAFDAADAVPPWLTQTAGAVAILASSRLPGLGTWAAIWEAVGRQRREPTRCVLLAEGTDDGAPGALGSLAGSPLAAWADVVEGVPDPADPLTVTYDYDDLGRRLWGGEAAEPPAPGGGEAAPAAGGAVPAGPEARPRWRMPWPRKAEGASRPAKPPPAERIVLPPSRLIVVCGGKGGVGKTLIAASLIQAAADLYGGAVGVDCDYPKPNLALHFWPADADLPDLGRVFDQIEIARNQPGGLPPEAEARLLGEWLRALPVPRRGILVVPGPRRDRLQTVLPPEGVPERLLEWALGRPEPVVVVDTDPALDEAAQRALERVAFDGMALLVTTPERDAILEADRVRRQVVEVLGVPPERLGVVVNHRGAPRSAIPAEEIARIHLGGLPLLGEVPWVPRQVAAALAQAAPVAWGRRSPWPAILAACTGREPVRRGRWRWRRGA
ncbi:MAG: ParA family protein [Firmicutes bacterium]|nr:ParA family protein [Bacillota bacterium]